MELNELSQKDREYLQYWWKKREIEEILENKGVSYSDILAFFQDYKHWKFTKYKQRAYMYGRHKYIKKIDNKRLKEDKVLNWCLSNEIPTGERNRKLLKNLAIMLLKAPITDIERQLYIKTIIFNCKDKKESELTSWIEYFKNQLNAEYNESEVDSWCYNHKLFDIMYKKGGKNGRRFSKQ